MVLAAIFNKLVIHIECNGKCVLIEVFSVQ